MVAGTTGATLWTGVRDANVRRAKLDVQPESVMTIVVSEMDLQKLYNTRARTRCRVTTCSECYTTQSI